MCQLTFFLCDPKSSLCVCRLIIITATPTQLNSFIPHFPLPLLNIVTVYCVELKEEFIDFTRHKSLVVYGELTDFFSPVSGIDIKYRLTQNLPV